MRERYIECTGRFFIRELKAFNCYRRAQVILSKAERRSKRVKKVNTLLLDAEIINDAMTIDYGAVRG